MNHLAKESSPYLLQHKDNPVWWHPWGEEAFKLARDQHKPIFLSIGYASCYWCHVMEHGCFEDHDVAAALNRDFVSIKVDREERPDIDAIYMDAVVTLTGHGGWPMSVFLTPDLKPFWGGTYFPKPQFLNILEQISGAWASRQKEVAAAADSLTQALETSQIAAGQVQLRSRALLHSAASRLTEVFDPENGGFGPEPKFPQAQQLRMLLRSYRAFESKAALNMVNLTLKQMARGGIFDQIGGGFSRYATDRRWIVPHFEKMLYDNALLVVVLLELYQITGAPELAEIVRETLQYLERELQTPDGVFMSSQDAGDVDKEGEFYVWNLAELGRVLSKEELELATHVFGFTSAGNFEGRNIPVRANLERTADSQAVRGKLFELRQKRAAPAIDSKVLTDWNGMAISAFACAGAVLKDSRYIAIAVKAADVIMGKASNGELRHSIGAGSAAIQGMLDDYVFMTQALLDLYCCTADGKYLDGAERFQATIDGSFWIEGKGYASSIAPHLISQKFEFMDGATPAGNGIAARNLARLSKLRGEKSAQYVARAKELFMSAGNMVQDKPWGFPSLLLALDILDGDAHNVCDEFGCAIKQDFFGC